MSNSHNISLTSTEAHFCELLDDFSTHRVPPVECRIAGGWVRDKLLALPSSDLDIALTISSGYTFAIEFASYLTSHGVAIGSVGRVAANPEQSKHLETGTTRILGMECDFVGLRNETYSDSRIPQIEPGTPTQDAFRRDLTINALFYNVHSRKVEDFTGEGLPDLASRIARTPLPPLQTFRDDPLRVLRCIRFASRFSLAIDDQVTEAMQNPEVKAELQSKVSKERVGIEVTKMLKHDPLRAIELIHQLDLHQTIFVSTTSTERGNSLKSAQILAEVRNHLPVDELLWLAAACSPFRDLTMQVKNKEVPVVSGVLSDGLKVGFFFVSQADTQLSNDVKNAIVNLFLHAPLLNPTLRSRSEIGMAMQRNQPWERALTWATVVAILPVWTGRLEDQARGILNDFLEFRRRIVDLKLPESVSEEPLLNGNEVQTLLNIRPSPTIQAVRVDMNKWQLDNPGATKRECEEWLLRMWASEQREKWEVKSPPAGKRKR
ncbi:hypothetical protein TREMEDRAFT_68702 [Tremella mesenterica DSM 1558]|uniref:uncharacterized protein n=1 Tax=Tremella mesenterica (strain ATCC 24925 / CBS 8224 / DSM 1558 / NBRC 9311 / NRRL Y-6157 / RJB 2259-6 / UBC 559-6) TaxID=578456 RepID=UPI0003F4A52A|nr:uncharacterized protein TREMEDRAFT_68702 [Tremella mesenterica DSM 1558]EIW69458.1 hypothetical protein TREMEDRAFT_68702 [Tremella mesenterica DSM 1558]